MCAAKRWSRSNDTIRSGSSDSIPPTAARKDNLRKSSFKRLKFTMAGSLASDASGEGATSPSSPSRKPLTGSKRATVQRWMPLSSGPDITPRAGIAEASMRPSSSPLVAPGKGAAGPPEAHAGDTASVALAWLAVVASVSGHLTGMAGYMWAVPLMTIWGMALGTGGLVVSTILYMNALAKNRHNHEGGHAETRRWTGGRETRGARGIPLTIVLLALLGTCAAASEGMAACGPGTRYPATQLTSSACEPCPRNTWNAEWNQTACIPCTMNTQLAQTGAQSNLCANCPNNTRAEPGGDCRCPTPDYTEKACTAGSPGCNSNGKRCISWADATPKKPITCDYLQQWRNTITGECTRARRRCNPGDDQSLCCALGLSSVHTQTQDSTCYLDTAWGGECPPGHYKLRSMIVDTNGVVMSPLECRLVDECEEDQYELRPPGPTQDRVCVYKTNCGEEDFYEAQPATNTSDAICLPRTRCDYGTEYLRTKGGRRGNDECGTTANPCQVGTFLSAPATNATRTATGNTTEGTPGECSPYTKCRPGQHPVAQGTLDRDQQCEDCPAGTFGVTGAECIACQTGTWFSSAPGSTHCTQCTSCLSDNSSVPRIHACPPEEECLPGTWSMCNATHDAVCTDCPKSWNRVARTGWCTPCAKGYHNTGENVRGLGACVECKENTFCDSPTTYEACPNLQAFQQAGAATLTWVPSSIPGSSRPSHCTCADAGGFDSQASGGSLAGCIPCQDGYYSAPSQAETCLPCPRGTWSQQRTTRDHYKCPIPGSTLGAEVRSPAGALIRHPHEGTEPCEFTVGATSCTTCPTNHTRRWPATSQEDCSLCEPGQWYDGSSQTCSTCSAACDDTTQYETRPCTEAADRVCATCDRSCEEPGEFSSRCPGYDPLRPERGCGLCTNLPAEHAAYTAKNINTLVRTEQECTWACDSGYYADTLASKCTPCTELSSTTCPAGLVMSECTGDRDATCTLPCRNSTLPSTHASYALSKLVTMPGQQGGAEVVFQGEADKLPNQGCLWRCDDGYDLFTTTGGLHACRARLTEEA